MKRYRPILLTLGIAAILLSFLGAEEKDTSIIAADGTVVSKPLSQTSPKHPLGDVLQPLLGNAGDENKQGVGLEGKMREIFQMGGSLQLSIDLTLQQQTEAILDAYTVSLEADEIIAGVMESRTGRIVALASSNRSAKHDLKQKGDIPLFQKFTTYPYEPGAVMMPLVIAAALERGYIEPGSRFDAAKGRMELEHDHVITDPVPLDWVDTAQILSVASNIAISKIAFLFSGAELRESLGAFGLGKSSGIALLWDYDGYLRPPDMMSERRHRAGTAYGYGVTATFVQLLKAYNVFNNEGVLLRPRLIDAIIDREGEVYAMPSFGTSRALSKKAAEQTKAMLVEAVAEGCEFKAARYPGLEVGGMGAAAYIAKNGHYIREYRSSFYGFANDSRGNGYTIGILVIRPKAKGQFTVSRASAPLFQTIVNRLVKHGWLHPDRVSVKEGV